ncbi:hypothetical protein MC885_014808 [Smutsia gigantea]|nr:hypothetical protein MC885_014808 [Smutsia gigantea]
MDTELLFQIFGVLLTFVDLSLIITELIVTDNTMYIPLEFHSISLAIALFFLMDILLQVFVEGIRSYFSDIRNSLDTVIIVVILLVDIVCTFYDLKVLKDIPRLAILFCLLRLIILIRVFHSRYVGYFADMKNIYNWTLPLIKVLTIKKLIIYLIHSVGKGN